MIPTEPSRPRPSRPRPSHPRPSHPRLRHSRPARLAAFLAAAAFLFAACGSSAPTSTPGSSAGPAPTGTPSSSSGPSSRPTGTAGPTPGLTGPPATTSPADAAAYAAIEQQVEQLRGLTAKHPVAPRLMDEAALGAYVDRSLAAVPADRIEASDALLKALGLLPPDASLGADFKELFTTQVAGFYDPDTKELYVVSKAGGLGPVEKVTFAHEFTHALQDQTFPNFGGDEFQGATSGIIRAADGNSDRSLGELALIEGDPTLVMTYWAQQHLSPTDLIALIAASSDPETARILTEMPPILRETLMFPYTNGIQFVLQHQLEGGWPAVDELYSKPPASTEQVLHPEKYGLDAPVTVTLPTDLAARMGTGWTKVQEDTLGELQLRVWLESAGGPAWTATADAAAAGWGGDRIELVRGPDGAWALILRTTWDGSADAHEFTVGATATIGALKLTGRVLPGAGAKDVDVVIGSDATTMARLANILGLAG